MAALFNKRDGKASCPIGLESLKVPKALLTLSNVNKSACMEFSTIGICIFGTCE